MRNFVYILLLIALVASSCEGRKTRNQALSEDIEEFKKTVTVEIPVYEPESYIEREVDTLLYNGYRVKINTFSDMENSVLFTKIKDTVNYQTHYRNFKFNILVEKNGKSVYNRLFDKKTINKLFTYDTITKSNIEDDDFDKLGVLKSIELNDDFLNSESVQIDIMYAIPNTNRVSLHTLSINEEGLIHVERKELN